MPFDGIRNSALVRTITDVLEALPDLFRKEIRLALAEFSEKIKDGVHGERLDDCGGVSRPDFVLHPD